jgi:hypothetical protein
LHSETSYPCAWPGGIDDAIKVMTSLMEQTELGLCFLLHLVLVSPFTIVSLCLEMLLQAMELSQRCRVQKLERRFFNFFTLYEMLLEEARVVY